MRAQLMHTCAVQHAVLTTAAFSSTGHHKVPITYLSIAAGQELLLEYALGSYRYISWRVEYSHAFTRQTLSLLDWDQQSPCTSETELKGGGPSGV